MGEGNHLISLEFVVYEKYFWSAALSVTDAARHHNVQCDLLHLSALSQMNAVHRQA